MSPGRGGGITARHFRRPSRAWNSHSQQTGGLHHRLISDVRSGQLWRQTDTQSAHSSPESSVAPSSECLFSRKPSGEQDKENRHTEQIRSRLREAVLAKVCDLFHPDQQRGEWFNVHRRVRIEVVSISVEAVPERADGERPEVRIDSEKIDDVAHLAKNNRAERHQNDQTKNERHPAHLHEIGFLDRLHADVMIEVVDLVEMLAV